jgi:zinc transporter ZupT
MLTKQKSAFATFRGLSYFVPGKPRTVFAALQDMDIHKLIEKLPIRLILSVVAGIATASILSVLTHEILHLLGIFPPLHKPMFDWNLVLIALIYHSIFAVVGAFVTAWIAKEKSQKAAFILGSKEAIMWLLGIVLLWHHSPPLYNLAKAILGIPLAVFGGWLYAQYKKRKDGGRKVKNTAVQPH